MGFTYAKVTIKNIQEPAKCFTARFLVDSGASDSLVPCHLLRQDGIKPARRRRYRLATGRRRYEVGHALIALKGDETAGDVIFGTDKDEPLLGVNVLQSLGLLVDPVRHRLVRVGGLLKSSVRLGILLKPITRER